jgi:hypothetical protein
MRSVLAVLLFAAGGASAEPVFRVTLAPALSKTPVAGRLLLFASDTVAPLSRGWRIRGTHEIAGIEATLTPGQPLEVASSDTVSGPVSMSVLGPGRWHFVALLDRDRMFGYRGADENDLVSDEAVAEVDATGSAVVALTLSHAWPKRTEERETDRIRVFARESRLLSDFWKRTIELRALVVLPKDASSRGPFPVAYIVHGWGGDHRRTGFRQAPELVAAMDEGLVPPLIYVFLDGSFATGHHVFADSECNGPWATALVTELIPALEKAFPAAGVSEGRFLTGHSSGGWAALWLQVTHPDVFGGTWATSPDPVDFRDFLGVDLTAAAPANFYRDEYGRARLVEQARNGHPAETMEDDAREEAATGPAGGQLASFEWVFSPRGADGLPRRLFDRRTGAIDAEVAHAWSRYDIRRVVEERWEALAPKLDGKLTVIVGAEDENRLDGPTRLLYAALARTVGGRPFHARLEVHEHRGHMDLFEGGLRERIFDEMERAWLRSRTPPAGRVLESAY